MEKRRNAGEIVVGMARLLESVGPNSQGDMVWGWALPGGGFTADKEHARAVAAQIDRIMRGAE